MIAAILIGRGGSKGFPGKNTHPINGIPLMGYPLLAALNCPEVTRIFFSTDSEEMKKIAFYYIPELVTGINCLQDLNDYHIPKLVTIIDRPPELATDEALGEDVFVHAYNKLPIEVEFVMLLFANAPCITSRMMSEMIKVLRENPSADSCCTVSKYNMFSPYRMRKVHDARKRVFCYMKQEDIMCNCDRDSGGDFYIYDCSCAVVKPKCLQDINYGYLPQPWLGRAIIPYKQDIPALDLDYEWQLGQIQYWIDKHRSEIIV